MQPVLSFDSQSLNLKRTDVDGASVTFVVRSTAPTANCPLCGQVSARPHSRYVRRLSDLPRHDRLVRIHLEVRRFFCGNAECRRRIFAERLPGNEPSRGARMERYIIDLPNELDQQVLEGCGGSRDPCFSSLPGACRNTMRRADASDQPIHTCHSR